MVISAGKGDILDAVCDILVVNLFKGVKIPSGATGAVDKALGGEIGRQIKRVSFEGNAGEILVVHTKGDIPAEEVWVLGLGDKEKFTKESLRRSFAEVIKKSSMHAEKIITVLHGAGSGGISAKDAGQALAESALLSDYFFGKYKSQVKAKALKDLSIVERDGSMVKRAQAGIDLGIKVSTGVNFARDLVNEPPSTVNPTVLADQAKELTGGRVKAKVYGRAEAEKMKMGAFLAVASGSKEEPKFIHLSYTPSKKPKKKIVLVGKAITFDSGGLNIKSESSQIHDMKMDMSGAATLMGLFKVINELKPAYEVHALIAATENMPGGGAYRPGDIVRSMSGKTIEIGNTDAEGRVTLADSLHYASTLKPDQIIDFATLTGACMVALGDAYAGVFGRPQRFVDSFMGSGSNAGELYWQLPLPDEYRDSNKSLWADTKNISAKRWGGAITAALFLEEFVDSKIPWIHVDIAGPAFSDSDKYYNKREGTGFGVRTLIEYLL